MAVKKTSKHELEYDTETSQAIFNGRNTSALAPTHKPLPERFFTFQEEGGKVVDNTLELASSDSVDEENNTVTLVKSDVDAETHSIEL